MTESHSSTASASVLIHRFLAKDPKTVERVVRLAARVVAFHGYSIPTEERRDVSQEVVLQVWRCLAESGPDDPGNLEALVRSVAYRRCVDWLRRRRSTRSLEPGERSVAPWQESGILQAERHRLARDVLSRLGEGCRQLIRMHTIENCTYREISSRLGRSEGALRVQMSACLKKAREIVDRMSGRVGTLRGLPGRT